MLLVLLGREESTQTDHLDLNDYGQRLSFKANTRWNRYKLWLEYLLRPILVDFYQEELVTLLTRLLLTVFVLPTVDEVRRVLVTLVDVFDKLLL